jgi:hypothetical protein
MEIILIISALAGFVSVLTCSRSISDHAEANRNGTNVQVFDEEVETTKLDGTREKITKHKVIFDQASAVLIHDEKHKFCNGGENKVANQLAINAGAAKMSDIGDKVLELISNTPRNTTRFHEEEKLNHSNNDNSEQIFIPLHEIGTEDNASQLIGNNEEFA